MFSLTTSTPRALGTYRPNDGYSLLRREMDDLIENFFNDRLLRIPMPTLRWRPTIAVEENDDAYLVKVELPGVELKDVAIKQTGDILTISAKRTLGGGSGGSKRAGQQNPQSQPNQRGQGADERGSQQTGEQEADYVEDYAFEQSLTLPDAIETAQITAELKQGILRLTLPKSPAAKPKQIAITGE